MRKLLFIFALILSGSSYSAAQTSLASFVLPNYVFAGVPLTGAVFAINRVSFNSSGQMSVDGTVYANVTAADTNNPLTTGSWTIPSANEQNILQVWDDFVTFSYTNQLNTINGQPISFVGATPVVQLPQAIVLPSTASVTMVVAPAVTSITYAVTGGASGLPVTFTVSSGPGVMMGNLLKITGAGTIVITANQAGNIGYSAAPQVTQTITVTMP